MLDDYHQLMDAATTREEMNAATLSLAGQVLEKGGIEANWDNTRRLMTAALEYASGGGVISQVLNDYDLNTWKVSEEANRAFVSMGRYIKQMLESQDEAGYAQLMGFDVGSDVKYSVQIDDNGRKYVEVDIDQEQFDGLTEAEARVKAQQILEERFLYISLWAENGEAMISGRSPNHIAHTKELGSKEAKMMKLRAMTELNNIMEAAHFTGQEEAKHKHGEWKGGIDAVDGYEVTIKLGPIIADYHITVGNRKDGWKEIYDIRQIKESTQLPQAGGAIKEGFRSGKAQSASTNNITDGKKAVKSGANFTQEQFAK